jgi:hypothetical protein
MIGQRSPYECETGAMVPEKMIDTTTFQESVRLPCPAFYARCAPRISEIGHDVHNLAADNVHSTNEISTDRPMQIAKCAAGCQIIN